MGSSTVRTMYTSYVLLYLCISMPLVSIATLSKSDRGGKVAGKKPSASKKAGATAGGGKEVSGQPANKNVKTPAAGNAKQPSTHGAELGAGANTVTWSEIVRNHDRLDAGGDKQFPNTALGYVTPWHNKGYTLAESEANRFELISPVWLQLTPAGDRSTGSPATTCKITGTHDVDHGWMSRLRKQNPDVKIVPRLLFEKWPAVEFIRFFGDQGEQDRCADVLLDYLQRNEFSGAVVELWMLVMSMSQGHVARKWGPLAPLDWVQRCLDYLVRAAGPQLKSKLLLGINFYGYQYTRQGAAPSQQQAHNLPQVLNKWKPTIVWNKNALEHYFKTGDATIYYPSLQSLALRLDLAKKMGVGVAIWDLGQGLDYFYNLL